MKTIPVSILVPLKIEDNQLFLWAQKRRVDGPLNGFWEFPGGKIESDESALNAIVREVREEVGITIDSSKLKLFKILPYEYSDRRVSLFTYIYPVIKRDEFPQNPENKDQLWHPLDQILYSPEALFPPANNEIFSSLKAYDLSELDEWLKLKEALC